MKHTSLSVVVLITTFLSINTRSICMENNKHIGTIDTLMLWRSILQNGYDITENNIKNHHFINRWTNTKKPITDNPYCIVHLCLRNDDSALSDQVFDTIDRIRTQRIILSIKNSRNQRPNAIDECTRWVPINNSDGVIATAAFYNKKALITLLNGLRKYEQQEAL